MSWHQIPEATVAGIDVKPVAYLSSDPDDLAGRYGLQFDVVADDLDTMQAAALVIDGVRFLLLRYEGNPVAGTEVHTVNGGDPATHARAFAAAFAEVTIEQWWDGSQWRPGSTLTAA